MNRAAILAFKYVAVAIVDEAGRPIHSESLLVEGADVSAILATFARHGVDRVAFDLTGSNDAALLFLGRVRFALPGMSIEAVDVAHADRKGAASRAWAALGAKPGPRAGRESYEPQALALALASLGPMSRTIDLSKVLEAAVEEARQAPEEKREEKAPEPTGRRVIGIDPGGAWIGVVVAVGDVAPLHVVARKTVELGHVVPFTRPVKTKSGKVRTRDREVTWKDIGDAASRVHAMAIEYGATHAVIERVVFTFGMATRDLIRDAEVASVISERLRAAGLDVTMETAQRAQHRVTKGAKVKGEARSNATGRAVAAGFADWPARGDDAHQRDAGLLALLAALPKSEPAPPRARPARTGPVKDARARTGRAFPSRARARASNEATRAAAGCLCRIGGRHVADCPLNKAKTGPVLEK